MNNCHLIVQIPCYNEEGQIAETIADIPSNTPGVSTIETVLLDDGSTDNSIQVAKEAGIDTILSTETNKGLADVFRRGMMYAQKVNADIVVNFDGDHGYRGTDIPTVLSPIRDDKADYVIGQRPVKRQKEAGFFKRTLYKVGNCIIGLLIGKTIHDAPSGLRAMNQKAINRINITGDYTYTIEGVLKASYYDDVRLLLVDVGYNKVTRKSKLINSKIAYCYNAVKIMTQVVFNQVFGK